MEHASGLHTLSPNKDIRPGQKAVVDLFAAQTRVVAQLPVGYGKTRAAVESYIALRNHGAVNRILYIVPRGAQARQAAEEVPSNLSEFGGIDTKSYIVGDSLDKALRAHRAGTIEVFVTTIQALVTSRATLDIVSRMMETGRWFVVVDEYHHYGISEDSVWTKRVLGLPSAAFLAMSATPNRRDGPSPFGNPDPSAVVRYVDAERDGYVKELRLHSYEYRVDAITINGDIIPFSTQEILAEVGSDNPADVDRWLASRQMRWSPKYISPLIDHPVARLIDLKLKGVPAQMLVQALSCSHAKMVCEQVKSLVPEGMTVDWVGTGPNGRTDTENEDGLLAFCPPKDRLTGKRPWTLQVLVNVGIAGEGLDTADVCEVVFLTSPRINNTTCQTIGRGARPIVGHPDVACTVNVDGASELARFVGRSIMRVFDQLEPGQVPDSDDDDNQPSDPNNDYEPLPDTLSVSVLDVTLIDIRTDPMYQAVLEMTTVEIGGRVPQEQIEAVVESKIRAFLRQRDERFNASAVEAQGRDMVDTAVRKLAGLVVRRMSGRAGIRFEKSLVGDIARRINSQKKRSICPIEDATEDDLKRHYAWVKQLEAQILGNMVPPWLR